MSIDNRVSPQRKGAGQWRKLGSNLLAFSQPDATCILLSSPLNTSCDCHQSSGSRLTTFQRQVTAKSRGC